MSAENFKLIKGNSLFYISTAYWNTLLILTQFSTCVLSTSYYLPLKLKKKNLPSLSSLASPPLLSQPTETHSSQQTISETVVQK